MNFVPFSPVVESARAQDLGNDLSRLIDDYRRQHPGTTDADVHGALRIAARRSGGTLPAALLLALTAGLLILVLLGMALVWMRA
jgi:hypothetical protein